VHGELYDYSKINYKTSNTKVNIVCRYHGDFWQIPQSHLAGSGCLKCSGGGYRRSDYIRQSKGRDSRLYIIKCSNEIEQFYKIGITFNTVKIRYGKKYSLVFKYEIIHEYICDAGCVWDLEKELHKLYKPYQFLPTITFEGYTECFNLSLPIDEIINNLKIT
jgi:hypothetical protein